MSTWYAPDLPEAGEVTYKRLKEDLEEIASSLAFQLPRNKTRPQGMDLDMNGHRVLNLPVPKFPDEPVRRKDFFDLMGKILIAIDSVPTP